MGKELVASLHLWLLASAARAPVLSTAAWLLLGVSVVPALAPFDPRPKNVWCEKKKLRALGARETSYKLIGIKNKSYSTSFSLAYYVITV